MSSDPALAAFSRLRVWERGGQRAPHKPLLVLLTLSRWVRGGRGPYKYADIDRPLRELLVECGPPRKLARPSRVEDAPTPEHVAWHHEEVFQGRSRASRDPWRPGTRRRTGG